MAYRDERTAIRAELDKAREVIHELEARVTPELVRELPHEVAQSLTWIRQQAEDQPATADGMRKHLEVFRDYQVLLDDVIARAPGIDRSINHVPRAFPDRVTPSHPYGFPDVYDDKTSTARTQIHRRLEAMDAAVKLADARPKYFDRALDPYLVDACFRVDDAPLRLIVIGYLQQESRWADFAFSLFMRTPRSLPALRLLRQTAITSLGAALRLIRDTEVGDEPIDDAIIIDADAHAAARVLTPEVRDALLLTHARCKRLAVHIDGGVARIEWQANSADVEALEAAVRLMVAIRRVPPLSLLNTRAKRRPSG